MNSTENHVDYGRLNDFLEGLLDAPSEDEIQAHLDSCDVCRAAFEGLTGVVADLGELAGEAAPRRDLWEGIEARISDASAEVVPLRPEMDAPVRRVNIPVPLAWAAGITIALLSGSTAWFAAGGSVDPAQSVVAGLPRSGDAPSSMAIPVGADRRALSPTVENLEVILEQARASLDPETVQVLEESLSQIAEAIMEAEAALAADPGNAVLNRILGNHQRAQYRLIGQAASLLART